MAGSQSREVPLKLRPYVYYYHRVASASNHYSTELNHMTQFYSSTDYNNSCIIIHTYIVVHATIMWHILDTHHAAYTWFPMDEQ